MSTWTVARIPRVAFVLASAAIILASTLGTAVPASGASPSSPGPVLAPIGQITPTALGPGVPATNRPVFAQPFRALNPGALRAAKLHAAALASRGSRGPSIAPRTPLAGLFNNLNSPGLSQLTVAPPDSTGAIGPNNYVEMVNQQIGVYDRNLNLISSTDNGTFTGAGASLTVTDPQIQWDGQSGHWLYVALGVATGANMLIFGWSKTSDPSDLANGWCRFGTPRGNLLDDYPKLGHDDHFISVGANVYDDSGGNYTFVTANIFVIGKPATGDASCSVNTVLYVADAAHPLKNADGSTAFTPVPANTADPSALGYIVAAHSPVDGTGSSAPKIMVWHWALVSGAPALVSDGDVGVPTFDIPAPVPQPGTSYTLDSLDARLTQAVAVNDPAAGGAKGIWTQHTVAGPGGRSVVRWYEIMGGAPPTLRQQGDVGSPTDFVFNGAVSPSIDGGSAAVFYNRGGASTLPVIGAQTRSGSTPLGTLDTGELVVGQSSATDLDFTCGYSKPTDPCRWGDYAGASPDPLHSGVVWGSSQVTGSCFIFCGLFAQWQTQNFAVLASTAAPQVLTSITVLPATVSVQNGGTQLFTATGYDQNNNPMSPQPSFTWSVSGGGSINSSGLFAATTVGGPFTVTAASGGLNGTASVSVTAAPQVLTSITVLPATVSVQNGGTQLFTATGYDQNNNPMSPQPSFTWSVSGGGSINSSGLFAATTVGGPFTVTAASGGLNGTASVSVTAAPQVLTSITVLPATVSVQNGGTQLFTATGYDQNNNPMSPQPSFTWSVSGGGSINSSGLFTATTVGGPFTVTAASGGLNGTASVSVTDFSLSRSPASRSIKRGQNTSYNVTITRLNGFAGSVLFTIGGLPSNVTASFTPNPTNGTSVTLRVSTSRSSPTGTYTLQITGTSGGLTHLINVSLSLR